MGRAEYKVDGGKLLRVRLARRGNTIEKIRITGDFFLHPEEIIDELERELEGRFLIETDLAKFIETFFHTEKAVMLGFSAEDLSRCIVMAGDR